MSRDGVPPPSASDQRGVTLVELLVVLFLTSFLGVTLASSISLLLRLTDKTSSDVTRALSVLQAVELISEDVRQGHRFAETALVTVPGATKHYGSITSTVYGVEGSPIPITITYAYVPKPPTTPTESESGALVRHVISGTETVFSKEIAQNIEITSHVRLDFTPFSLQQQGALFRLTGGEVTARITSTVEGAGRGGPEVFTATAQAHLRNQEERTVNAPGPTPTPIPEPGEVIYKARVITVTVSSTAPPAFSVTDDPDSPTDQIDATKSEDGTFFTLAASSGVNKRVIFVVDSQPITQTGLTKITVNFSSQTNRKNTQQRIFVYNCDDPAHDGCDSVDDDGNGFIDDDGFHPTDPDDAHTFTVANSNVARSFELASEDVTFVNGQAGANKFIRIAMRANSLDDANFDLKTDLIQFRVVGD